MINDNRSKSKQTAWAVDKFSYSVVERLQSELIDHNKATPDRLGLVSYGTNLLSYTVG